MSWLDKMKDKFIDECRQWWKLWSTWLAVLWGAITSALWYQPEILQEIANVLPQEVRLLVSPLVFGVIAGLPIVVRLLKQSKLERDQNQGQQP